MGLLRMGHDLFSSGLRGLLFKSNKGVSGKVKTIKGLRYTLSNSVKGSKDEFLSIPFFM